MQGLAPIARHHRRWPRAVQASVVAALILMATLGSGFAASKQVLILHSFGREFRPWSEYAKAVRSELSRQSPWPLDITDYSIVSVRSASESLEAPLAEYLSLLYGSSQPDLIVVMGAPAAGFVERQRARLFPRVPLVFTAVDQRFVQRTDLTANDAAVAVDIEIAPLFQNILQVLPNTETIAIVSGNSPSERIWVDAIRKDVKPFENRARFEFWNDLSFEDMLKAAAALPADSAIFWPQLRIDAAGVVHEGNQALQRLSAVANAPIFSYDDTFFSGETVGGPMFSMADISRTTAEVAIRILGGESPAAIKVAPFQYAAPRYDWRQLKRWGISETNLPPGSQIMFREPILFEKYTAEIAMVSVVFMVQLSLIGVLIYERRLRVQAEGESRRRLTELAHINRRATAGELCSSLAHELSQPLGAILANTEAAELMLRHRSPDLHEVGQILADIRRDDERAGEVIFRLRSLLKKRPFKLGKLDLNEAVCQVIGITSTMAQQHQIAITRDFSLRPLRIRGDAIQLQQVILNLVVNAIDAITEATASKREIVVRTAPAAEFAEVSIVDSGPGIQPDMVEKVFDPFYTTKHDGMGMGLSIARTIVTAHGGRIWAESARRGAAFHICLPLA